MHDIPEFRVPFDTNKNPINIIQGFNGPWTHNKNWKGDAY